MLRQWYFSRINDIIAKSDKWIATLEKGLNGDWEKEGYTIAKEPKLADKIEDLWWDEEHPHFNNPDYKPDLVNVIHAKDKDGNIVGHFQYEGNKVLNPRHVIISSLHQRKGLATAMYTLAEKAHEGKVVHGGIQSPQAKALWNQPNRKEKFGKVEQLVKAILSRTDLIKNDPKAFFEHPTVKNLLHEEIQNMHYEVKNAVQGQRSGFQDDTGQNINTSTNSTFPEYYSHLKVDNKDHFAKVMNSKKGPIYQRMLDVAHDRLLNGYSNHHGQDMPNPKYLVQAVQHGVVTPQEFHERMRAIDEAA